jgi:hypothetical protein
MATIQNYGARPARTIWEVEKVAGVYGIGTAAQNGMASRRCGRNFTGLPPNACLI